MIETEYSTQLALRKIIDSLSGHIYIKNLEGRYVLCNQKQAKSLNTTVEDILGKTDNDLYWHSAEDAKTYRENDLYVIQTGQTLSTEEPAIVDGKHTIVLSKKTPLRNDHNEIIGILGISIDITAQKEAENLLLSNITTKHQYLEEAKETAENTLKNIINLMPGHVYWKNLQLQYLGCNQMQAESGGFASPEEFCGKTDADMPWHARTKEIQRTDREVIQTEQMISTEEVAQLSDGRKAIFLSKKVPLKDNQGKVTGILGISFDITGQKEAERLRLANAIIEQKAKTAAMLAAGIAHELRTPLAAVNLLGGQIDDIMARLLEGYTLAVQHGLVQEPLTQKSLRIASQVGMRLLRIVRSANMFIDMMLMKVNLDQPHVQQPLTVLSICAAVDEALQTYPLDDQDQALVHWDRARNQAHDFNFQGDQTLFNHVIFNLLKNALHYVKAAGRGEIQIWVSTDSHQHCLHFRDTGTGIAAEALPYIFDEFYTRTAHGTGVGLALCKIIMQQFNGEIQCQSVQNEYTHFTLTFPTLEQSL